MNIVFMSEIVEKKPVMSILMERQPQIPQRFNSFLQEMLNYLNESDIGNVLASENTSGDKSHAITMDNIMEIMLQDSVDDYFIIACWYFFGEYFLAMQLAELCYASELPVSKKRLFKMMMSLCLAREYNIYSLREKRDSLEKVMSDMYKTINSYDSLRDLMSECPDEDLIHRFIQKKIQGSMIQKTLVCILLDLESYDDAIRDSYNGPVDSSICWKIWNTPVSLNEANDLILRIWCWAKLFKITITPSNEGIEIEPVLCVEGLRREKTIIDWKILLIYFEELFSKEVSYKHAKAREFILQRLFDGLCIKYGEKKVKQWFGLQDSSSLNICSKQLTKMTNKEIYRIIDEIMPVQRSEFPEDFLTEENEE